jgi:hypothetical protein
LDFVNIDFFYGIGRTKTMFKHGASAQIAQLCLNESAQIAGCPVFHAEHGMEIIVVLDDHARAKLGRGNGHGWLILPMIAKRMTAGTADNSAGYEDRKVFILYGVESVWESGSNSVRDRESRAQSDS